MDRLNYYNPFTRKESYWEDPLTRAYLMVLRHVPLAQAAFVDHVRKYQLEQNAKHQSADTNPLPPFAMSDQTFELIQTQKANLPESGIERVYSIAITNEKWTPQDHINHSDRSAKYDGILKYGSSLLVIEVKPHKDNLGDWQLHPNVPENLREAIDPNAVILLWRDLIASLTSLINRELLTHAEKVLIDDFIEYVAEKFVWLNPYTTLSVCGNKPLLIRKRLLDILTKVGGSLDERGALPLQGDAMTMAWLEYWEESNQVKLELYPGDTVSQARPFYQTVDIEKFLTLGNMENVCPGWKYSPNLHFSFMGTHLHWSRRPQNMRDYLLFWRNNANMMGRYNRSFDPEFKQIIQTLESNCQIDETDISKIHEHFTNTGRQHMNVIPGVSLIYSWPLATAVELDRDNKFVHEVLSKIKAGLETWSQEFLPVPPDSNPSDQQTGNNE